MQPPAFTTDFDAQNKIKSIRPHIHRMHKEEHNLIIYYSHTEVLFTDILVLGLASAIFSFSFICVSRRTKEYFTYYNVDGSFIVGGYLS